jgi:Fe-S cluster assembly ATP-binding protein
MGPNGAGKSTLSYVLSGREGYEVTTGSIVYKGENLLDMEPEQRSSEGVFLAFQYPVEIPGVSTMNFLKASVNSVRRYRGQSEFDAMEFLKFVRRQTKVLNIGDDMLKRAVNVGFSGGEKKRAEVLQMAVLEPTLAVLDETDSGLDVDALRIVGEGVTALRSPERSMLVITHYQRLLDYIIPDVVHVLSDGKIVDTGNKDLAVELEKNGYASYSGVAA